MSEIYFDGIEVLKGVLILFVILGHLLARTPNIDHFLYVIYLIIYSFSMPLFIGISGFLLNKKFMIGNNIKNILLKYTRRVIIPFLICLSVFAVLNHFNELNIRNLLGYIFLPQVWLWYIPFIIFTTFLVIIFLKLNVSDREILIFCCLISLFWIIFYYLILTPSNPFNIFEKINYTYRPEYICFFAFGYYLRNNEINIEFVQLSYFSLMVFSIYRVYYI
jgi:fucose 4-O-acetylase-like acetyltransferase